MTTPTVTSTTDSQMHNNIMAAGSRDRPPMLATGRYPHWRLQFLRYIDTRPNGDALRKCILNGPYIPTTVLVQAVAATDDSPGILKHTTVKTPMNMSPTNKAHFESEKEAIHLILTGIRDEIYSTKQVNELRVEKLAWNANPLVFVATTQANQDLYYQTSKSHKSYALSSKPLIPTRSHTTTRYKGKEIAKPITPPSESAFKEDSDPEQAQRDKDMQKHLAFIAKYFKNIYKPTNNNLRTSSNSRNTNMEMNLRYKNDNQSGQFGNQRTMNVARARENVDSLYHKEKMLLCKQAEKGVPLQAEQYDWLADTDEEIDKQELEAHYSYMVKIQELPIVDTCTDSEPLEQVKNDTGYNVFSNDLQHSEQSESISNTCIVEMDDSNVIPDSPDMCDDVIQHDQNDVESDDECVALANLIANLKLDNKQTEFEKYKAFNDRTVDYDKLERKLNETLRQLAQIYIEIKEGLKLKAFEILVVREKHDELIKQSLLTKSHYEGLVKQKTKQEMHADLKYVESLEKEIDELESDKAEFSNIYDMILQECVANEVMCSYLLSLSDLDALAELQCLYLHKVNECKNDTVWNEETSNVFRKEREQYIKIQDLKAQLQDKNIAISELKKLIDKGKGNSVKTKFDKPSVVRQQNAQRIPKPSVLGKPAPLSDSLEKDIFQRQSRFPKLMCQKVYQNQSLHRLYLKQQGKLTSNVNAIYASCRKCLVDSDHFACVTKMLNDVNARTKKPNVVPISTRKPKGQANKSVATPH
uniref:Uncharacterized protein n=1 Tax=Tanacetum cinerariifolium TaxID=118510 RepID=A0A6L2KU07_TANCI|nr:hypothetical protein [Tanacetum cinerariifolium]